MRAEDVSSVVEQLKEVRIQVKEYPLFLYESEARIGGATTEEIEAAKIAPQPMREDWLHTGYRTWSVLGQIPSK